MSVPPQKYCGDEKMREHLGKAGATLSLAGIYGLFGGCLAACDPVLPPRYLSLVFGDGDTKSLSERERGEVESNLTSLWNMLAASKPDGKSLPSPDIVYPDTLEGLKERVRDNCLFIEYFIRGLDIGGLDKAVFPEDGIEALKSLGAVSAFLKRYEEGFGMEKESGNIDFEKTSGEIGHLEKAASECIARLYMALKKEA